MKNIIPKLISVVIPTFQHAKTISVCLDSIFAQTYKDIEIIIVNDGSTDDTADILKPYVGHITIINQENQGSNPARNRGWEEAVGEFVIFCDADVRMEKTMLEKLHSALSQNKEASFSYCAFRFGWKVFPGVPFNVSRLKQQNYIHTTALVRSEDFPGFDPNIKRLQDWDVWLTMVKNGKVGILVPEILFNVEISGESRIGSSWIPSFFYRLPWGIIGWRPKAIKKYEDARTIIAQKHSI